MIIFKKILRPMYTNIRLNQHRHHLDIHPLLDDSFAKLKSI